jgi:hypothetical protein
MAQTAEELSTKELIISITADDQLHALVLSNTRHTTHEKNPENVIRLLTLLASGYTKSLACKMTGISRHNLTRWAREQWYTDALELIRDRIDEELDASLTAVIHKGAREVVDRLDNGDYIMDKEGTLIRKPLSGREAMLITGIAHDKRSLKRGKPTTISENVSTDSRLDKLAQRFRQMSQESKYDDAVEAEFVEVEKEDSDIN